MSTYTFGDAVRDVGYNSYISRKEQELSSSNKSRRLKWALEHQKEKDWRQKIFIDETKINSSGADGPRVRV